MAQIIGQIGRLRVTKAAHPSEAGYIRSMRIQTDHLAAIIKQVSDNVHAATAPAIQYALQPIFEKSQEYVPVDTGRLKRSGFNRVDKESRSGNVRVLIGYGRYGKPHYAAFVHEMVHIPHARGTRAKFLEDAVNEGLHLFKRRLVRRMGQLAGFKR